MGYSVDVKTTHLTTSGDVFAGPARVLGVYYCSEAALGTIVIRDGAVDATVLATFDVPIGQLITGAVFFALRSCEYTHVSNHSKIKMRMINQVIELIF